MHPGKSVELGIRESFKDSLKSTLETEYPVITDVTSYAGSTRKLPPWDSDLNTRDERISTDRKSTGQVDDAMICIGCDTLAYR